MSNVMCIEKLYSIFNFCSFQNYYVQFFDKLNVINLLGGGLLSIHKFAITCCSVSKSKKSRLISMLHKRCEHIRVSSVRNLFFFSFFFDFLQVTTLVGGNVAVVGTLSRDPTVCI